MLRLQLSMLVLVLQFSTEHSVKIGVVRVITWETELGAHSLAAADTEKSRLCFCHL